MVDLDHAPSSSVLASILGALVTSLRFTPVQA